MQMLATVAWLLHATLGIPVGDVARPKLLVIVHVEPAGLHDTALLADATLMARDIWRPYVDVAFGRAGDIQRTIEADQLDLVVTNRLLQRDEPNGLGWIQFVNDQPAQTITVSTTAAQQLMEESTWSGTPLRLLPASVRRQFIARALGRSIAHEMGHYLLRSKTHGRRGLMRDHLTADDIMEPRHTKDRLEPDDLKRLDGRLYEYAAAVSGDRSRS